MANGFINTPTTGLTYTGIQDAQKKRQDEESQQQDNLVTGGGAIGGGAPSAIPQTPVDPGRTSGQFTNVQKYVAANRGAGEQMAQGVGGTVGRAVGGAQGAVGKATEQIDKLKQEEMQRFAGAEGAAEQIQQDPTKIQGLQGIEVPEDDLSQYTLEEIQRYLGADTNLDDIRGQTLDINRQVGSRVGEASHLAGQTADEAGRYDLLRRTFGRPGYTSGEQRLDQLLVQSEGRDVIRNLQRDAALRAAGLEETYGGFQDTAEQYFGNEGEIANRVREAQELVSGTLGAWGPEGSGELGGLYQSLYERGQNLGPELQAQLEADIEAARTGNLTPEIAARLGVEMGALPDVIYAGGPPQGTFDRPLYGFDRDTNANQWMNFFRPTIDGVPLSDIESAFTDSSRMATAASEEERRRLNALNQLAGLDIDLGDALDIGTQFDEEKFDHAVQKNRRNQLESVNEKQYPFLSANQLASAILDGETTNLINNLRNKELQNQAALFGSSLKDQVDFLNQTMRSFASGLGWNPNHNFYKIENNKIVPVPYNYGDNKHNVRMTQGSITRLGILPHMLFGASSESSKRGNPTF